MNLIMYKEMIISIMIVVFLVIGDFFMQNYAKKSIENLTGEFQSIKESLEKNNQEETMKKIDELKSKWQEVNEKLAFYIEHNELEKVESNFVICESLAKSQNYDFAISSLDETIFALQHIGEKYKISLENIF